MRFPVRILASFAAVAVGTCAVLSAAPAGVSGTPDSQMQMVLDQLGALGGKPIETLSAQEARKQPTPADAVKELLKKQGKSTAPEAVGNVANRTIAGPGGQIPIRVFTPKGTGAGPFPVIFYIHGGGWVIADLDTYDSSPRALANAAGAVVVSTHYRQAPEHKFPAAHDDTWAAYKWTLANAASIQGDPRRVAVVGESAGGNMAAAIAIRARDEGVQAPVYQVLIYPVATADMNTPSRKENTAAKPLNTAMMAWFGEKYLSSPADGASPKFSILKANLKGLPPATVITAQIDPLRSEGKDFADRLKAAGVPVEYRNYDGATHEFFGMGAVVDKAKDAVAFAAAGLKKGFGK
ncbi:MAG: alpha/beta hydrolase [Acidobacteriota bacterium]|nr:alpha/beta hydrolase [Acidobacteriota bacterium]